MILLVVLSVVFKGIGSFVNVVVSVELEADYRSYGSPAIAHKRAEHLALKPIDRINL